MGKVMTDTNDIRLIFCRDNSHPVCGKRPAVLMDFCFSINKTSHVYAHIVLAVGQQPISLFNEPLKTTPNEVKRTLKDA